MLEAVRFLQRVGRLLGGAEDAELLAAARADLEVLRLAEPGSDFLLAADGVRWGRRAIDIENAEWIGALRAAGLVVLAPPDDEPGFRAWVAQLAGQVESAPVAPAPEVVGTTVTELPAAESAPARLETSRPDPEPPSAIEPPPTAPDDRARAAVAEVAPRVTSAEPTPGRSLQAAADRIGQIHDTARDGVFIGFADAASLVEALAAVLDEPRLTATPRLIAPLDEYSTIHALNVGLLAMRLARHLALGEEEVIEAGVAGLLHDIGKIRLGELPSVSLEMLSPDERAVLQAHSGEGARLLLDAGPGFERAAIVAYEHHMSWHGEGGYPTRHFERPTHAMSRIVSVCDAYDVLRTERSFRPALDAEAALSYLRLIGGQTLDPDLVTAFIDLAAGTLPRVEPPRTRASARPHEIGWLPETGYDPDCEPRPVRL